jgi:uncharacterized membrane protein YbhN (UPF0104 family)
MPTGEVLEIGPPGRPGAPARADGVGRRGSPLAGRLVGALAVLAGLAALLRWLPHSVGASWADVAGLTQHIRVSWLLPLPVVWLAGLLAHTAVFTASLPGLTTRRALALNMAGSAVGNAVPLGGAVSVGLTSAMIRSWGFTRLRVGAFLVVSSVWNVVVRLVVGVVGLLWLAVTQSSAGWRTASVMAAMSAVLVACVVALLASDRTCARGGALLGQLVNAVARLGIPRRATAVDHGSAPLRAALALVRLRRQVLHIVVRGWLRMSAGMVAYLLLLAVLLDGSLRAVGTTAGAGLVLAAVAIERLVTSVPLTPGGSGVAELGLTACLTISGVDPVSAVMATLIYRTFTFVLEIPVGLAVASAWAVARRRSVRRA